MKANNQSDNDKSPVVSVIMPCHNRSFDLNHVLEAYEDQDIQLPFELIAIDDASTDNTYAILCEFHAQNFTLIVDRFDENKGPASARNRGISLARSPIIIFVGDDIYPSVSFISGHRDAHNRLPDSHISVLGRTKWAHDVPQNTLMEHIDGIGAQQFSYQYLEHGHEYDYRHLYTSNISIKREMLYSLDQWFDVDFGYAAFEDVELAFRLAKQGLRIIYDANIIAEHYHYHTIWSFTIRQIRSGMMAWVLIRKHPQVAFKILRTQLMRYIPTLLWSVMFAQGKGRLIKKHAQHLEDLALHLASYFEWSDQVILDAYYLDLLQYFYNKGLLTGFFKKKKHVEIAQSSYANLLLVPILQWFRSKIIELEIALPIDLGVSLEQIN